MIEQAIDRYHIQNDKEGMISFMDTMLHAIKQGGDFVVPYITTQTFLLEHQINNINIGDTFTLDHDVKLKMETVKDVKGNEWLGVFTSSHEMHKGSSGNFMMDQPILTVLELVLDWEEVNGIVINPFGKYMQLTKDMIAILIGIYEKQNKS